MEKKTIALDGALQAIKARKETIDEGIKTAQQAAKGFPSGRLRVSTSRNRNAYYHVTEKFDSTGKYISLKDTEKIAALAQKDYNARFLRVAKAESNRLGRALDLLTRERAEEAFEKEAPPRKSFIHPYILTDEMYAAEWQRAPIKTNPYLAEGKSYETRRGEKVRSKSEAIIADILQELGIPYHYEKALELEKGVVRYPDFTILNVKARQELYLEHFGLLGDESYRSSCLDKLDEYRRAGIFLGKNLIFTYEDNLHPLDIGGIRAMLRELCGVEVR